jgi:hypothetical protein
MMGDAISKGQESGWEWRVGFVLYDFGASIDDEVWELQIEDALVPIGPQAQANRELPHTTSLSYPRLKFTLGLEIVMHRTDSQGERGCQG